MPVANLVGFRPSPRYDLVKWVQARISEAVLEAGPWLDIDLQALPDYPDPLKPPRFSFTTTHATAPRDRWYLVTFLDPDANDQEAGPVYFGGLSDVVPTADDIRAESRISFEELGYAAPATPGDIDPLDMVLLESMIEFQGLTGIDPTGPEIAADRRGPLIRRAIRLLVEYNAARSQQEILETVVDFDLLGSMAVGAYSETRRAISGMHQVVHPHPGINSLLGTILGMDALGQRIGTANVPVVGYATNPPGAELMRPKHRRANLFDMPPLLPRVLVSG